MGAAREFLSSSKSSFQSQKGYGESTMEQLTLEQLHWKPNGESNSIALLVRHLNGNMLSRWTDFLTTDGEKPTRNRDREFEDGYAGREQLLQAWEEGWSRLFAALDGLSEDDLVRTVTIGGQAHTALEAIQRQISHYGQHIGQMMYIGKLVLGEEWKSLSIPKRK